MFLLPLSDELRYLNLYGVPYYIPWEELLPGYSFFLKTTATSAEIKRLLIPAEKHFRISLAVHPRVEFGYYGARVWRLA